MISEPVSDDARHEARVVTAGGREKRRESEKERRLISAVKSA